MATDKAAQGIGKLSEVMKMLDLSNLFIEGFSQTQSFDGSKRITLEGILPKGISTLPQPPKTQAQAKPEPVETKWPPITVDMKLAQLEEMRRITRSYLEHLEDCIAIEKGTTDRQRRYNKDDT